MIASWHPEDVLEPRFRWSFPETHLMDQGLADAALGRGIGERMTGLLARRGVTDAAGLDAWFADPMDGLHDPRLLPDADRLVARMALARERAERVMVFGDFDADGLDGLAILVLALRRYGLDGGAIRPEPAGRGPRPVAGRGRCGRAERRRPHRDRGHRVELRGRDLRRGRRVAST